MIRSSVSDLVIVANAAPMITPTARSSTLPCAIKVRNSFHMAPNPLKSVHFVSQPDRFRFRAPVLPPYKTLLDKIRRITNVMKFRAALALAGAVLLSACGLNSVPTAEENAKARWADVQTNYQRRADLIPNLVATAKGAAGSEGKILTDITNARASASQ